MSATKCTTAPYHLYFLEGEQATTRQLFYRRPHHTLAEAEAEARRVVAALANKASLRPILYGPGSDRGHFMRIPMKPAGDSD
jgi:hypothetical protein